MANGAPVNERPLLPSLIRTDAIGVSHWSSDLTRQLITVFQQYGYRINQSVTDDELAAELADVLRDGDRASQSGTLAEVDQNNLFAGVQSVANPVLLDGESWNTPTLLNGWVNYGGSYAPARFRKLPSGLVLVQGLIRDGSTGSSTASFVLPTGYRPNGRLILNPRTSDSSSNDRLDINTNGDVLMHTGGNNWFSIDCQFFADQ